MEPWHSWTRSPSSALSPFHVFGGGFPYSNRLQKQGHPYSNLSTRGPSGVITMTVGLSKPVFDPPLGGDFGKAKRPVGPIVQCFFFFFPLAFGVRDSLSKLDIRPLGEEGLFELHFWSSQLGVALKGANSKSPALPVSVPSSFCAGTLQQEQMMLTAGCSPCFRRTGVCRWVVKEVLAAVFCLDRMSLHACISISESLCHTRRDQHSSHQKHLSHWGLVIA